MDEEARDPEAEDEEEGRQVDLLTIGLFVFFVALIVTVGALLLIQAFV